MKASQKEESFEQALKRLEQIVQQLEGGDLILEESLSLFEEGVRLTRVCSRRLDDAEKKITLLTKGKNGQPIVQTVDPKDFINKGSNGEGSGTIG
jgi:exodeoxyribonuclease VII small subunit